MANRGMNEFVGHLRRAVTPSGVEDCTDEELLRRFTAGRDEAAFAALVDRHGPLVWGVCRRVLRHEQDAEDAFQATFLVLARKAGSVASPGALAGWLFGVARRAALKALRAAARRKAWEKQVSPLPEAPALPPDPCADLGSLLDSELARLPPKYRAVLLLCDLEGRTRSQAAAELGLPEGTVASRLARARGLLAGRLTRRGLVVPAGSLGVGLLQQPVPADVAATAIKSAILDTAGLATGVIPGRVLALAEGVHRAMTLKKLTGGLTVLLVLGVSALAWVALAGGGEAPLEKQTGRPAAAAKEAEGRIRPGDRLHIQANNTLPDAPIKGVFRVEPWGTVPLGVPYGRVRVSGQTPEEAEVSIRKHLATMLKQSDVQVTWYDPLADDRVRALEGRVRRLESEVETLREAVEQLRKRKRR